MQTELTSRADLWVLAVALYKTSLPSAEEVGRWERHAASFVSHELEGDRFVIGVADTYAAEYYYSSTKYSKFPIGVISYVNATKLLPWK